MFQISQLIVTNQGFRITTGYETMKPLNIHLAYRLPIRKLGTIRTNRNGDRIKLDNGRYDRNLGQIKLDEWDEPITTGRVYNSNRAAYRMIAYAGCSLSSVRILSESETYAEIVEIAERIATGLYARWCRAMGWQAKPESFDIEDVASAILTGIVERLSGDFRLWTISEYDDGSKFTKNRILAETLRASLRPFRREFRRQFLGLRAKYGATASRYGIESDPAKLVESREYCSRLIGKLNNLSIQDMILIHAETAMIGTETLNNRGNDIAIGQAYHRRLAIRKILDGRYRTKQEQRKARENLPSVPAQDSAKVQRAHRIVASGQLKLRTAPTVKPSQCKATKLAS